MVNCKYALLLVIQWNPIITNTASWDQNTTWYYFRGVAVFKKQGSIQWNFNKCNLQLYLLFQRLKTIATLVKYAGKSFIELTAG